MNYNELDLNLIKTFICVYETKSILAASKKLYVSQPAVTNSIKRLEDFLGGQLFIRTPKGVIATTEGEQFNNACYNALHLIDNGIKNFLAYSNLQKGKLNIGSSSTIMRQLLIPFITEFSKRYPNIIISITDATSTKLVRYAKRGDIDLAIMNTPIENIEAFNVTPITKTTDCFIVSKDFKENYLTKEELKNYPLILQKRPSNNRDYFEEMCLFNNINLTPNYEIGSFGLITDFTEKGMGVAYTIKNFIEKDIENNRVKELKTDFVIKPRDVVIITPQNSINSFACKIFIKELANYLK